MTTKKIHQFSDFLINFTARYGQNHRGVRAVIDSLEIYTINSVMKKKIETTFIMFVALF